MYIDEAIDRLSELTGEDFHGYRSEVWGVLKEFEKSSCASKDALLSSREGEIEGLKKVNRATTCVYCGKEYSIDEPTENITKHIETCEKHPCNFWREQAELYKSEFLGRDHEWKKAKEALAEKDAVICRVREAAVRLLGVIGDLERCSMSTDKACDELEEVLTTTSPCPHESALSSAQERVRRAEETIAEQRTEIRRTEDACIGWMEQVKKLKQAIDEAPRYSLREVDSCGCDDDPDTVYDGMETNDGGEWINRAELRRRAETN